MDRTDQPDQTRFRDDYTDSREWGGRVGREEGEGEEGEEGEGEGE